MDETNDSELIRKQTEAFQTLTGSVLDVLIQIAALQITLVEARRLDPEQVQKHVIRLEGLDAIRALRNTYGAPSTLLQLLLQSYEGPVQ